jgi:hypothetical protein
VSCGSGRRASTPACRPRRAPALADFLDVERYPEIVFASTEVEQIDDDVCTG